MWVFLAIGLGVLFTMGASDAAELQKATLSIDLVTERLGQLQASPSVDVEGLKAYVKMVIEQLKALKPLGEGIKVSISGEQLNVLIAKIFEAAHNNMPIDAFKDGVRELLGLTHSLVGAEQSAAGIVSRLVATEADTAQAGETASTIAGLIGTIGVTKDRSKMVGETTPDGASHQNDAVVQEGARTTPFIHDRLGAPTTPSDLPPVIGDALPPAVWEPVLAALGARHPTLAAQARQQVVGAHYALLPNGAAGLVPAPGGVRFLCDDTYATLPAGVTEDDRTAFLTLHLVHELTELGLAPAPTETLTPELHREVVATLAQAAAYRRLDPATHQRLQAAAAALDAQAAEPADRWAAVLAFYETLDPTTLWTPATAQAVATWLQGRYAGFAPTAYNPAVVAGWFPQAQGWVGTVEDAESVATSRKRSVVDSRTDLHRALKRAWQFSYGANFDVVVGSPEIQRPTMVLFPGSGNRWQLHIPDTLLPGQVLRDVLTLAEQGLLGGPPGCFSLAELRETLAGESDVVMNETIEFVLFHEWKEYEYEDIDRMGFSRYRAYYSPRVVREDPAFGTTGKPSYSLTLVDYAKQGTSEEQVLRRGITTPVELLEALHKGLSERGATTTPGGQAVLEQISRRIADVKQQRIERQHRQDLVRRLARAPYPLAGQHVEVVNDAVHVTFMDPRPGRNTMHLLVIQYATDGQTILRIYLDVHEPYMGSEPVWFVKEEFFSSSTWESIARQQSLPLNPVKGLMLTDKGLLLVVDNGALAAFTELLGGSTGSAFAVHGLGWAVVDESYVLTGMQDGGSELSRWFASASQPAENTPEALTEEAMRFVGRRRYGGQYLANGNYSYCSLLATSDERTDDRQPYTYGFYMIQHTLEAQWSPEQTGSDSMDVTSLKLVRRSGSDPMPFGERSGLSDPVVFLTAVLESMDANHVPLQDWERRDLEEKIAEFRRRMAESAAAQRSTQAPMIDEMRGLSDLWRNTNVGPNLTNRQLAADAGGYVNVIANNDGSGWNVACSDGLVISWSGAEGLITGSCRESGEFRIGSPGDPLIRFWDDASMRGVYLVLADPIVQSMPPDLNRDRQIGVEWNLRILSESEYRTLVSAYQSLTPIPLIPEPTARAHRFPKVIKGQDSWAVLARHLREDAGIEDEDRITQILTRGGIWTDRATGEMHEEDERVLAALATGLTELLGREVTVADYRAAVRVEELMHARLPDVQIQQAQTQLQQALGEADYQQMLAGIRRMYGYDETTAELELVEEAIAKTPFEQRLGNPLRLLNAQGEVVEVDPRAARVIDAAVKEALGDEKQTTKTFATNTATGGTKLIPYAAQMTGITAGIAAQTLLEAKGAWEWKKLVALLTDRAGFGRAAVIVDGDLTVGAQQRAMLVLKGVPVDQLKTPDDAKQLFEVEGHGLVLFGQRPSGMEWLGEDLVIDVASDHVLFDALFNQLLPNGAFLTRFDTYEELQRTLLAAQQRA